MDLRKEGEKSEFMEQSNNVGEKRFLYLLMI